MEGITMRRRIVGTFTRLLLLLTVVAPAGAHAGLERQGPISLAHGYPEWYQDKSGLIIDFCSPVDPVELADGWCLLLPADVPSGTVPEAFPGNFSEEHFYWTGDAAFAAAVPDAAGNFVNTNAHLILALEAAFAVGGVIPGDQVVFGRVRIILDPVPVAGTYVAYTPSGTYVIPDQVAGTRLFYTEDIGFGCPLGRFDCALSSNIGPFLVPSDTPGGAELPPVLLPATGRKYIADPGRIGPVTGSPFTFTDPASGAQRSQDFFRLEVTPTGATAPIVIGETSNFALTGRIFEGAVPGRVTLDRASYAQPVATLTQKKVDVFATALPTTQGRLPAAPTPLPVEPLLVFYDAPCGVDPLTGALTVPVDPGTGQPLAANPMFSTVGWKYSVGQSHPAAIPAAVCLEQQNAVAVGGGNTKLYAQAPVTDQIFLTGAVFDPNAGTMTVSASSSDRLFPPTLTVAGYGTIDPASGQLVVPALAPPNRVTVLSSGGGLNQRLVNTLFYVAPALPLANPDAVTVLEDSPATPIAVLANDTMSGSELPLGAVVTLVAPPLLGTAVVNLDQTISYTPNPNSNLPDGFQYSVTLNGIVSNVAGVTITVTPVNDLPVAVNDTFAVTVNPAAPTATNLNVFTNDTDPDGKGDLGVAINLVQTSGPAPATITGGADGVVSFLAPVTGIYTFTYEARDKGGGVVPPVLAVSNAATATVTASGETLTIVRADYIVSKARWRVEGTASPNAGQTITLSYADGPNTGYVLRTTAVAAGAFAFDFAATGLQVPTNAQATRIAVTGPGGGTAVAAISRK